MILFIIIAWLLIGYIAGRIAYFEFEEVGFAIVVMVFGPIGYLTAMCAYSGNPTGGRRVAHFLPANYCPAFIKFLASRRYNGKTLNPFNIKGF